MNDIILIILSLAIFWLALEHGSLCMYTLNLKSEFEDYKRIIDIERKLKK